MEQGSKEWLDWRKQGIGASESAALLLVCPYKTPRDIYNIKTGTAEDDDSKAELYRRGHETEAMVRATHEFETGLEFPPALFEHPEFPFIRASLDGWNEETKAGIEIKMVGKEKYAAPIPEHHQIQLQHQMLVTATDTWTYIRHCEGQTKKDVVVAHRETQMRILSACWQFWDDLQRGVAPAYTERDWIPDERFELVKALGEMRQAKTTKERNFARADVLALVKHKRTICRGVKITLNPDRVTFPKEEAHA